MLHFQLDDGRIPQQINWRHKAGFTNPLKPRLYSKTEYNDLTQIPVLPYSIRAIYNATGDTGLLREFIPPLVKHFDWWRTTRDLDHSGVVSILHPWESGLDLTPAYDPALGVTPGNRARPPWSAIYPQLIQLALSYRWRYSWDQAAILSRTAAAPGPINWFKVQDVAVNCVYASGWGILGDLAGEFDDGLAAECHAHQRHAEAGIQRTLFSAQAGHFVTGYKDGRNGQCFHPVRTVQMLFPLLLDSVTPAQVASMVRYLTDPAEFWTPYPVPSVSRAEPEYNPIQDTDLLWRGPTWGFTNWFVMEGLRKHGRDDLVNQLMDRWIAMAEKGGIWENYNPETAVGYEAEGLGMSVLIVDWMKRLHRI
jgi:glycogen debranching enzyme